MHSVCLCCFELNAQESKRLHAYDLELVEVERIPAFVAQQSLAW
eukprot:COSAG06_NODE_2670_length_6468_cov_2.579369_6_plen_44_part_00